MAVARIVSRSPQDVEPLANQLRARGYTVEIVSPDEAAAGTADLEIVADTCDLGNALKRAIACAAAQNLDIYVAAGTYLEPKLEPQPAAEPAPVRPKIESPVSAAETAAVRVERRRPVLVSSATPKPTTPRSKRPAAVRGTLVSLAGTLGDYAMHLGSLALSAGGRARDLAGELASEMFQRRIVWRQRWNQSRQQRAEARAERRRVVEQRQAALAIANASQPAARPRAVQSAVPERLPVIRRTRERESDWKVAAVFSVVVAVAVMIAWAAANRRPVSPLPASMLLRSNSMEQQIPFGPVKLPAPAALVSHQAPPPITAAPKRPTVKPSPMRRTRQAEDDEVTVRHFTTVRTTTPTRQSRDNVKRISDMQ